MAKDKPDRKPDVKAAEDRGDRIALMEPLVLGEGSRHRAELTDLALQIAAIDQVLEIRQATALRAYGDLLADLVALETPLAAGKPAVLPCDARACDELLLQQPDRRPRHAPN